MQSATAKFEKELDAAKLAVADALTSSARAAAEAKVAAAQAALDGAPKGYVDYRACIESVHLDHSSGMPASDEGVAQALYQHLGALEFIFRLIDVDASGSISKGEFILACETLNRFIGREDTDHMDAASMADAIDLDGDGRIDFNEFTESFRLVRDKDTRGRAGSEPSLVAMPGG